MPSARARQTARALVVLAHRPKPPKTPESQPDTQPETRPNNNAGEYPLPDPCCYPHPMPSDRITFKNREGLTLAGRLEQPDETVRGYALFAHCFTCTKDINAASRIARGLMQRGIAVLRFDFAGLGESEGEFDTTSFASNIDDLLAACDWMKENHGPVQLLIGHSLGGAAVLSAAARLESARAVATIGAPADPAHVRHLFDAKLDEIEEQGSAEVSIGGRTLRVGKKFVQDLEEHDPEEGVRNLNKALMIFHSPIDQVVGIENAAKIYQWARHPKSFISLDQADHLLSERKDADFVATMLSAWCERVLNQQ